jgi:two-component system response regulator FixJ
MPGASGIEVLREVATAGRFATIMLTGQGDTATAITAMKAGVFDFIEKPYDFGVLQTAVELAFAHLEKTGRAQEGFEKAKARIAVLSPRELQVLEGLVAGHANKTIAIELGISLRTVEIYRAGVMDKLKVGSLSEALRLAFTAGLIGDN